MAQRTHLLTDGTYLLHYHAKDSHGSSTVNYTHLDSHGVFIQLFLYKTRIVERLFGMIGRQKQSS